MHIHHVSLENLLKLESIFARLTPQGWITPEWLRIMIKEKLA